MENNTIIIVVYNTKELIENCHNSIRKHLPRIPILIINCSDLSNQCSAYLSHLNKNYTKVVNVNKNIGHGKGMDYGIKLAKTKYVTVMDSDTIMNKNPFKEMELLIKDNYGIGQVLDVNLNGVNTDAGIKYLHPYFALINRQKYLDNKPFIHHGAPCIETMIDLMNKNKSKELIDFPVEKYITHLGRGTRLLNPKHFHSKFWDKI